MEERVVPGGSSTNWTFGVFLRPEDAANFKALTATNSFTKLLIIVGNKPVIAPTIMGAIENGGISIETQDGQLLDYLKKQFQKLK